eukprot:s1_g1481.t1
MEPPFFVHPGGSEISRLPSMVDPLLLLGKQDGEWVMIRLLSMSTIALAGFVFSTFAASADVSFEFTGNERTLKVIGSKGDIVRTIRQRPAPHQEGLAGFSLSEQSDRPCGLAGIFMAIDPVNRTVKDQQIDECRDGSMGNWRGRLTVSLERNQFITMVRLCMNRNKTRVKGLEIIGRELRWAPDTTKTVLTTDWVPEDDYWTDAEVRDQGYRRNCNQNNWTAFNGCSASSKGGSGLVVGVVAHFASATGRNSASLTGLQLICRDVVKTL